MNTFTLPVSVKGIVVDGGKVWLRKNERNEWELPGGKIDAGEQPEQTLTRELKEELGFTVSVGKIIQAYVYTIQVSHDETRQVFVVTYVCELLEKSGKFEIMGEAGKAEFRSFDKNEIKELSMPEFYKQAIVEAWKV